MRCAVGSGNCLLDWWNHSYQKISQMHTEALTCEVLYASRWAIPEANMQRQVRGPIWVFCRSGQDGCSVPASAPVRNAELIFKCWSKFQPSLFLLSYCLTDHSCPSKQGRSLCKQCFSYLEMNTVAVCTTLGWLVLEHAIWWEFLTILWGDWFVWICTIFFTPVVLGLGFGDGHQYCFF